MSEFQAVDQLLANIEERFACEAGPRKPSFELENGDAATYESITLMTGKPMTDESVGELCDVAWSMLAPLAETEKPRLLWAKQPVAKYDADSGVTALIFRFLIPGHAIGVSRRIDQAE